MRFASLGSGSSGNSTLIQCGNSLLLVDCGFSLKEAEIRCSRLDIMLSSVSAILVTHEHTDHCAGVGAIARKYKTPVYMTSGTYLNRDFGNIPDLRLIRGFLPFVFRDIHITPVPVPHDAKEPAQYIFHYQSLKFGVLTDLGSYTEHIVEAYRNCDGLLVEFNHDTEMLRTGPYPPSLKRRVASNWGHLNNSQASQLLINILGKNTQRLLVGHISQKNNSEALAAKSVVDAIEGALEACSPQVNYACQDMGSGWLSLR